MSHDTGTFMFRCLCEKILFHISRVFFLYTKISEDRRIKDVDHRIREIHIWYMEYIRVACITGTLILKIARHSNDSMLNI